MNITTVSLIVLCSALTIVALFSGSDTHVKTLGTLEHDCKPDGTCATETLSCQRVYNNIWKDWKCLPRPKEPEPGARRVYESEQFCITCADKCGDAGVRTCAYSDTSVWGAKPALCECKP